MPSDNQPSRYAKLGQDMVARAGAVEAQVFGSFFLSRLLGFEISYETSGRAPHLGSSEQEKASICVVRFEAAPPLFNPQGTLHGGILATAMDISMGHLLHRVDAAGATLEMKVQYLAPITAGIVRCEGTFLRRGKSICAMQSSAFRADGELAAHATATWKIARSAKQ